LLFHLTQFPKTGKNFTKCCHIALNIYLNHFKNIKNSSWTTLYLQNRMWTLQNSTVSVSLSRQQFCTQRSDWQWLSLSLNVSCSQNFCLLVSMDMVKHSQTTGTAIAKWKQLIYPSSSDVQLMPSRNLAFAKTDCQMSSINAWHSSVWRRLLRQY
jgi:hypothetical protein